MLDPITYIREQLAGGVSYVILPNVMAEAVGGRVMELERDNAHLRAEIEVLQRMRHSNWEQSAPDEYGNRETIGERRQLP